MTSPPFRLVLRRTALCLAIGAAVNILVAWALALWAPAPMRIIGPAAGNPPPAAWPRPVPAHWLAPDFARTRASRGITRHEVFAGYRSGNYLSTTGFEVYQAGLPLRSLEWERRFDRRGFLVPPRNSLASYWLHDGIAPPRWLPRADDAAWRRVPIEPVWAGLAANTALYAALAWGALFAPGIARRSRRRRRGWCVACAYDLAGLPLCPECGAAAGAAR